jgi:hypothetical protein
LLWTHASVVAPQFTGSSIVSLQVPCTFDFNVAATKYFYALEDGEIPLDFLFSGSVFYQEPLGALPVGSEIAAGGTLETPEPWRGAYLRRQGIAMTLRTDRIEALPGRRGGLTGWIDQVRERAEQALGRLGRQTSGATCVRPPRAVQHETTEWR